MGEWINKSPYIFSNNRPHNPFPHSLLRTRQSRSLALMAWGGSGFSRLGDWGFTGPAVWLCGSEVCSGESVPYIHIIIHIYIMLYVCVCIYIYMYGCDDGAAEKSCHQCTCWCGIMQEQATPLPYTVYIVYTLSSNHCIGALHWPDPRCC